MTRRPHRDMLPPLLAVRAFEAAARRASFSLAAEDLHVTQSAVSRQVRLLEAFLGRRLFVRLARGVRLTPAGAAFHAAAQRSLDILEEAARCGAPAGPRTLRISITQSLAHTYVMPRLPDFAARRPDIEVRVLTSTAPADFQRDDIDAAIRLGPLPGKRYQKLQPRVPHELALRWNGIVALPLWQEVLTPVLSRELAAPDAIRSPRDLCRYPLLSLAPRPSAWSDWFRTRGESLPPDAATRDFGHFFMTLDAARAGHGVALVPTLFLRGLAPDGALFCPFASTVPSAGEYYFLCREEAASDGPVAAFAEWLAEDAAAFGRPDGDPA
ncbi:MAG: LysR substrate-binding domain-containing protein [Xylophilus ampelinus]